LAAGDESAADAGTPNVKMIKTIDRVPQTIGGKLGGSLGESKMRQSSLTVFPAPGQDRSQTRPERVCTGSFRRC